MKRLRAEYVRVNVGDVVEVFFHHVRFNPKEAGPFTLEVVSVTKRYGLVNGGRTKQNPLIKAKDDKGVERYFDNTYVTKVIKRAKNRKVLNVFKDTLREHKLFFLHQGGGVRQGFILDLAMVALSKLSYNLERPLDVDKLWKLYMKQKVGLRGLSTLGRRHSSGNTLLTVDMPRFQKWIRQNHSRVCATIAEMVKSETESNEAWEDTYDLDSDMEAFEMGTL